MPRPAPLPPATTAASPACPASGVTITPGEVDGAMGLRAMSIEMVNCGTGSYPVRGYPVVRVLDADRKPLAVEVGHGSAPITTPDAYDAAPQLVTLGPGDKVVARLVWRNTVTDSTVPAASGSYLEIAPSEGTPAQIVAPRGGIDLGNTGRLGLSAWARPRPN